MASVIKKQIFLKRPGYSLVLLGSLVLTSCVLGFGGKDYTPPPVTPIATVLDEPGEFSVAILEKEFRNELGSYPFTVYFPETGPGPFPAIVFSPGFASHKDKYVWVGEHLASHGYAVAIFTVPWPLTLDTAQHETGFTLGFDLLARENTDPGSPLFDRVDLERRTLMGHSLGGLASLRKAGTIQGLGAVIALAPAQGMKEDELRALKIPVQIQTGTIDCITGQEPAVSYYEALGTTDKQLVEIKGGNHIAFNDKGSNRLGLVFDCRSVVDRTDHFQRLSRRYFTAWLDRYLKHDIEAEAALFGDGARKDTSAGLLTIPGFSTTGTE